jgi:hypothetical protein
LPTLALFEHEFGWREAVRLGGTLCFWPETNIFAVRFWMAWSMLDDDYIRPVMMGESIQVWLLAHE